jgi:hypothetical protein
MGLPSTLLQSAAEPHRFEVWPANMPVVDTFLMIATQWRTAPLADGRVHWLGLDYGAVRAGFDMAGAVISPVVWAGVQVMERAASAALNGVRG